jgi:DNA-nicking Smr family endonuclease
MKRKSDPETDSDVAPPDAVALPIDGTLDLHTFDPKDLGDLIPDYLAECAACGILDVRIVHGKGRGVLRRSVEAILERSELVADFKVAGSGAGDWGATLVRLRAPAKP